MEGRPGAGAPPYRRTNRTHPRICLDTNRGCHYRQGRPASRHRGCVSADGLGTKRPGRDDRTGVNERGVRQAFFRFAVRAASRRVGLAVAGPQSAASERRQPRRRDGYAVLGIGGSSVSVQSDFEVYQSATVINGNASGWGRSRSGPKHRPHHQRARRLRPDRLRPDRDGDHHRRRAPDQHGPDRRRCHAASTTAAAFAPTQTFATPGATAADRLRQRRPQRHPRDGRHRHLGRGHDADALRPALGQFPLPSSPSPMAPAPHSLTFSGVTMALLGGVTFDSILWNMNGVGGASSSPPGRRCTARSGPRPRHRRGPRQHLRRGHGRRRGRLRTATPSPSTPARTSPSRPGGGRWVARAGDAADPTAAELSL